MKSVLPQDTQDTLESFLCAKHIDPHAFQKHQPQQYTEWQQLFLNMHPNSFYEQKRFLINALRRRYPLGQKFTKK